MLLECHNGNSVTCLDPGDGLGWLLVFTKVCLEIVEDAALYDDGEPAQSGGNKEFEFDDKSDDFGNVPNGSELGWVVQKLTTVAVLDLAVLVDCCDEERNIRGTSSVDHASSCCWDDIDDPATGSEVLLVVTGVLSSFHDVDDVVFDLVGVDDGAIGEMINDGPQKVFNNGIEDDSRKAIKDDDGYGPKVDCCDNVVVELGMLTIEEDHDRTINPDGKCCHESYWLCFGAYDNILADWCVIKEFDDPNFVFDPGGVCENCLENSTIFPRSQMAKSAGFSASGSRGVVIVNDFRCFAVGLGREVRTILRSKSVRNGRLPRYVSFDFSVCVCLRLLFS